jgi:hypothetical protein
MTWGRALSIGDDWFDRYRVNLVFLEGNFTTATKGMKRRVRNKQK